MNTILLIIVLIIVLNFIFDLWLDWLNNRSRTAELPETLQGIYDDKKYRQSIAYGKINFRFGLITGTFSILITMAVLIFGGFAWLSDQIITVTDNFILQSLLFFGILFFANDLINLPFSIYDTFVIEKKFDFNKTTVKTFIFDKIKSWFLTIILGGLILGLILYFYQITGKAFWIWAWLLVSGFSVFMAMFYSNLIVPLFNKQTPLEEGELRDAISRFAEKAQFKLDNIFIINGSKRSTKANAYFSGLGHKKRIVLYDTLIEQMTTEEIVAVLAHEVGHYKRKHVLKSIFISIIHTGILLWLFSLFAGSRQLSTALLTSPLGYNSPDIGNTYFYLNMIVFGILYSPLSTLLAMVMNRFSRRNEYQADRFAAEKGLAKQLISGLKKLSSNNLSNLSPHPAYVYVHYSHPTLLQRILAITGNKTN